MVEIFENSLEIREVEKEIVAKVKNCFSGLKTYNSFVYVGPKKYFFPDNGDIKGQMSSIYRMPIRCDDIFVCTFPRSGTTMTQELVWLVANNLDYNTARSKHLIQRCAVLGSYFINPEDQRPKLEVYEEKNCNNFDVLKRMVIPTIDQLDIPSPRVIKCHIPLSMLPPNILDKAKIIYVARDPRDVAVSLYHLSRQLKLFEFKDDFKTFWNLFFKGLVIRGPHIEQVLEAWKHRHHPNMLFIFYEDIIKDTETIIRKVCHFLDKHYTDEQIKGLCEHLKFENFKNNQSVNLDFLEEFDAIVPGEQSFVRKGKSGGWRDYFDEEMTQEAQSWIDEHLRYTDFKFQQTDVNCNNTRSSYPTKTDQLISDK